MADARASRTAQEKLKTSARLLATKRLAETVNGYYKAELIRGTSRPGPWRTVDDVELPTLGWVHWHNHQRLHGYLDDLPPTEFEGRSYATHQGESALVEIK